MTEELLSAWGRWRASRRKRVPITCTVCGKTVERYAGALTCSPACRQKKKRLAARTARDAGEEEGDAAG